MCADLNIWAGAFKYTAIKYKPEKNAEHNLDLFKKERCQGNLENKYVQKLKSDLFSKPFPTELRVLLGCQGSPGRRRYTTSVTSSCASLFAAQLQSVGLITGTIATGVFAVIICSVLVVVTIFYWKNKNKYDEEDVPNEIRFDVTLSFFNSLFLGRLERLMKRYKRCWKVQQLFIVSYIPRFQISGLSETCAKWGSAAVMWASLCVYVQNENIQGNWGHFGWSSQL